jgi:hypothetical protein
MDWIYRNLPGAKVPFWVSFALKNTLFPAFPLQCFIALIQPCLSQRLARFNALSSLASHFRVQSAGAAPHAPVDSAAANAVESRVQVSDSAQRRGPLGRLGRSQRRQERTVRSAPPKGESAFAVRFQLDCRAIL